MADERVRTMVVMVFGIDGPRLERLVEMVASRQSRHREFRPVFLTDLSDHGVFVRNNFTFEYFPRSAYGGAATRNFSPAFQSRISLLQRKWGWSATLDLSAETETRRVPLAASGAPLEADRPTDENWLRKAVEDIRGSGLFDEAWYRKRYGVPAAVDPVRHYLLEGAAKGYDPNPLFDTAYYARQLGKLLLAGG